MAVPSSGPLELRGDINLEVNGNTTDTNVALHQLSIDAGFSTPDAMSDFYGYTSVVAPTVSTPAIQSSTSSGQMTMYLCGNVTNTGGENVTRGFYFGTSGTANSNTQLTLGGTQATGCYTCTRPASCHACCTTYYNFAYACNSAGLTVGNRVQQFTPYPPFSPTTGGTGGYFRTQLYSTHYCDYRSCGRYCAGYINPYSGGWSSCVNISQDHQCTGGTDVYDCDSISGQFFACNASGNFSRFSHYAFLENNPGQGFGNNVICSAACVQACGCIFPFNSSFVAHCKNYYHCQNGLQCSNATAACESSLTVRSVTYPWTNHTSPTDMCNVGCAAFSNYGSSDIRLKTNINYL